MKKIILTLLYLICINAKAGINSYTHLFPINEYQPKYTDLTFSSQHTIAINNTTNNNQVVKVCYWMIVCGNTTNDWAVSTQQCENYSIAPHTGIQKSKTLSVTSHYPFNGVTCTLDAVTEISGDQSHVSSDHKIFVVK